MAGKPIKLAEKNTSALSKDGVFRTMSSKPSLPFGQKYSRLGKHKFS